MIKNVTTALLKKWPLIQPDSTDDKEGRGRILIIGGTPGMVGPVTLSALAALRAGAGKLTIATPASLSPWVAHSVLESMVVPLPELRNGSVRLAGCSKISKYLGNASALLIGPGMSGGKEFLPFIKRSLSKIHKATVVLDAEALKYFMWPQRLKKKQQMSAIVTPHAGEMAELLGVSKKKVLKNSADIALDFAKKNQVVVVLKGSPTLITGPDGSIFSNSTGNVGLATSGSGDTLSGIISGLAARGHDPLQSAVWGVALHARAGDALAKRIGRLGYLPSELLAEVPVLMEGLRK